MRPKKLKCMKNRCISWYKYNYYSYSWSFNWIWPIWPLDISYRSRSRSWIKSKLSSGY